MIGLEADFKKQRACLKNDFLRLTTSLAELLHSAGLNTVAHQVGLPHFSLLTLEEMRIAVMRVEFYYNLCLDHTLEKQSLRDSKRLTWRALVKLGLAPPSDLLERIEHDDIVEIYNADSIQLFRNLEFFDFCSYTLEELFCIQWWKLFRRENNISAELVRISEELFNKKHPDGLVSPLEKHSVVEHLSREKSRFNFFLKYAGPLYQNKRVDAIICIERALRDMT